MTKNPRTLRSVIKASSVLFGKFREAERLSKDIFREKQEGKVPLPYFTNHQFEYCKAVEHSLDRIIFEKPVEKDFIPTKEEALFLLAAAWLHDIGMIYGIFEGESPDDLIPYEWEKFPVKAESMRREHELRTSHYILKEWKLNCSWPNKEKALLANLCHFHVKVHPLDYIEPSETTGSITGGRVRLRTLATLLRLAVELASTVSHHHVEAIEQKAPNERLLLRLYVEEFSPKDKVVEGIVNLYRALNKYHIACGGNGLIIDDWQTFVREAQPIGAIE